MNWEERRLAVGLFLGFFVLCFVGMLTITVVQALQTGGGFGVGDTTVLAPNPAKTYYHDHPLTPISPTNDPSKR